MYNQKHPIMKNLSAVLLLLFTVSFFNAKVMAFEIPSEYEGTWAYECYDAPYPYHEGTVHIAYKDKATTVKITFKNGQSVAGKNVNVKDGKLSFEVIVEGNVVKTVLEQKGDKVTGKANSPEGVMNIVIKKKAEK
tara:strand:+ start:1058 stop:1462 length:405 start_codon:yes stop_codon:yes gene_type:complete